MIINNERNNRPNPFAYQSDVEEIRHFVEKNSKILNQLTNTQANNESRLSHISDKRLTEVIYSYKEKLLNDRGRLSAKLIRVVFMHDLNMKIGHNRAYTIKELLKLEHPHEFA